MPATYYPATIDRSASGFGVTFPDFAGCIASGYTMSEACTQAEKALALHIEGLTKNKNVIPAPSSLDDLQAVDGADDVALIMVRAEVPAKVERVLVSIDGNLLRAIDAEASNRSAFIADAARTALLLSGLRRAARADLKAFEDRLTSVSSELSSAQDMLLQVSDPHAIDKSPPPPTSDPRYAGWVQQQKVHAESKAALIKTWKAKVESLSAENKRLMVEVVLGHRRVAWYSNEVFPFELAQAA